jgi:hypothetical protein
MIQDTGETLPCSCCASLNNPLARFCSGCGIRLLDDTVSAPAVQNRVSAIKLEHAVTGLPAVPMVIEELSLDEPQGDGTHHIRAGIRISNTTDCGWARVEATATLFNAVGTPLASEASSIDYCIPARSNALLRPAWPRLAAAFLLNTPETFHVVVTGVAYTKHAYEVGSCALAERVIAPVPLGKLSLPGAIACLSFEVIRRDVDSDGRGFIDSRCVVQNLSPTTADYIEYALELASPQGYRQRVSGAVSSLKPGLIWSLEDRSWLTAKSAGETTAKGILNVFVPAGYGSVQRRGETVGVDEENTEDSLEAELTPVGTVSDEMGRWESQNDLFPPTSHSQSELQGIWAGRWREGVARFCRAAQGYFADKANQGSIPRNTFYFHPDIPQEKLNGALKAYPDIADDDVKMLIDDTFLGGARACLLLTDYGIYAYSGAEPVGMELGEMLSVEAGRALLGTMSTLRINDDDFFISGQVPRKCMNTLAELLETMRCEVRLGRQTPDLPMPYGRLTH